MDIKNLELVKIAAKLSGIVYFDKNIPLEITINGNKFEVNSYISNMPIFSNNIIYEKNIENFSNNIFLNERLKDLKRKSSFPRYNLQGSRDIFQAISVYDSFENTVYISIRGTENTENWLIDFMWPKTPFFANKNVHVHSGFNLYLRSILNTTYKWKSLKFWIDSKKNNPKTKFIITGHSLGGAVAPLMTAYLFELGISYKNIRTITFGQPAATDYDFVECYRYKFHNYYTRVVNIGNTNKTINGIAMSTIGDPVVISTNVLNYHHFGEIQLINKNISPMPEGFLDYLVSLHSMSSCYLLYDYE